MYLPKYECYDQMKRNLIIFKLMCINIITKIDTYFSSMMYADIYCTLLIQSLLISTGHSCGQITHIEISE